MVICIGLNVECPRTGLWFGMFVPQLVVLFWEAVEPLGGRALQGEVGHWEQALEGYSPGPGSTALSDFWSNLKHKVPVT